MGYWIDEDTYQYESEEEMYHAITGLDPETREGDYAEAYQHISQFWKNVTIDKEFSDKFYDN